MVDTRFLFKKLTSQFIFDLESIPFEFWSNKTCYPSWNVKDIISHLIQTSYGRLSKQRDKYPSANPPQRIDFKKLSGYIDQANDLWYQNFKELSPEIVFQLFKESEIALANFMESQELETEVFFPVAWVDEKYKQNWIDIGREYTERWNHQQQVREALSLPLSNDPEFMKPIIDILILSLPYWYHELPSKTGASIKIEIVGKSGGIWFLTKGKDFWKLSKSSPKNFDDRISLPEDLFCKFMMRSISPLEASKAISFSSDSNLCKQFLNTKAVMVNC